MSSFFKMCSTLLVFLLVIFGSRVGARTIFNSETIPVFNTVIETANVKRNEPTGTINFQVLDKPHHLLIGRCSPNDEVLHGENIIVNNDGKSHVSATIRINVQGPVEITCVKVLDQVPGGGGYASYSQGGVGKNYIVFYVTTQYGKGFNFYVQIYGNQKRNIDTPTEFIEGYN